MTDWRHAARCLDEDPELFFPIGTTGPAVLQIEEAKAVCRRCDVVETCLRWALDTGQDHGVLGGLSEDERRALKRRNARARRTGNTAPPPPPKPRPASSPLARIDAGTTRALLRKSGLTVEQVHHRTGLHKDIIRKVTRGSQVRITQQTHDRIRDALQPAAVTS